jgi:hypothetical protein
MVEDLEMRRSVQHGASLLAACLVVGVMGSFASAGISVSPLKQEVTVRPGETVKFKITVSNNRRAESDPARTVRLEVMDVTVSQDGALSFHGPGSQRNSASNWVSLGAKALAVEPGQSRIVECSLTAPYSASGEYYSAIMVTLDDKGRAEKGVSVTYRIASGVFVTVAGRSFPREAKIARCEVLWPRAAAPTTQPTPGPSSRPSETPGAKVVVLLRNTGQARFDATGRISIVDARSRTVLTMPLTSQRPCVFGGDSRLFEAPVDRPLAVGQYTVKVDMDYQSGWAKAYHRLPLEITPQKADLLRAAHKEGQGAKDAPIQVAPEKISLSVPAGSFRSLKLTIKNKGEETIRCTAGLTSEGTRPGDVSWIALGLEEFELVKTSQKTLEIVTQVPSGTAPGLYTSVVVIRADNGGTNTQITVPLELAVKAEK